MGEKKLHLIWLILPSAVFFLLVAAFGVRLSRRSAVSTEVVTVSPSPLATPGATPVVEEGLPSLVEQIDGWRVDDPRLAVPAFDRKIALPTE